ncbi:hypothetical protein GCM10007916_00470 [Psychromonas marina]|uniref:Tyr recombinase domain-containing protein n=1 Tax=Psychromonas marina TaxID=88364 RepID=A0ABQ6DVG9_9GAMM|nr:hypothetical protein GCM10007916_00470 [Psychromonas marina]
MGHFLIMRATSISKYDCVVKALFHFHMVHFTVHDLRRTCRSLLAAQGTPDHEVDRCLNNKLKGAEGIYDRYGYFEKRKEARTKLVHDVNANI